MYNLYIDMTRSWFHKSETKKRECKRELKGNKQNKTRKEEKT